MDHHKIQDASAAFVHGTAYPSVSARPRGSDLRLFLLSAIIIFVEVLPSLPVYLRLNSSLALGTTVAAVIAILLTLTYDVLNAKKSASGMLFAAQANDILFVFAIIGLVVAHGFIASRIIPIEFRRFGLSLIPLALLLAGSLAVSYSIRRAAPAQLHTASWVCFWLFIGVIVLRLAKLEPMTSVFDKATFPFTETSHFALAFGPIYLYRCVTAPKHHQVGWIILGFCLTILLKSATFGVFAFGAALLCRKLAITTFAALLGLLAGAATHLSYFTSRADISSHSSNVSALVYAQGWEFIGRSIEITHGWGLGFQQLGVHPLGLAISRLIRSANKGMSLNIKDGGFLLSKLVSEFGVFGIALTVAYGVLCVRCIHKIRSPGPLDHDTFARCVVVAFGVDMFIRGMGYFYGSPLLFLGSVFSISPAYAMLRRGISKRDSNILVLR